MIDDITRGIETELRALLGTSDEWSAATIMERTDFDGSKLATYAMPLVLWEEEGGEDFMQMLGGMTMCDWIIYIDVYNHRPDISGNDVTGASAETKRIADDVREHFGVFELFNPLSDELKAVFTKYGIKWTLAGVTKAPHLEHPDGLCKGHRITFNTVSWDDATTGWTCQTPLQTVTQTDPPPYPDAP